MAVIKQVSPVSSLTSVTMKMACVLWHCNKGAYWRGFAAQTKGSWPKGKLRTCISDFSLKFVTQRYANVFIFSPIKTQEIRKKILLNITSSLKGINCLNKRALMHKWERERRFRVLRARAWGRELEAPRARAWQELEAHLGVPLPAPVTTALRRRRKVGLLTRACRLPPHQSCKPWVQPETVTQRVYHWEW